MVDNPGSLQHKVVLVTGGGRGLGRAIALACAVQGARVAVLARSQADLSETESLLNKDVAKWPGQKHLALRCDVNEDSRLTEVLQAVTQGLGPIYGLVCAAGVYGSIGAFAEAKFADWEAAVKTNLLGTARTVHKVLPTMLERRSGRIVLFSGGGQGPMPNFLSYVTSKGGIWRFNETLAAELAPKNIFVNAIAPGAVNTALLDDLLAAGPEKVGEAAYQKSLQQKKDGGESADKAAALCVYLLSEKSKGLYGKIISAIWDDYSSWTELEKLSQSDKFTPRRVT